MASSPPFELVPAARGAFLVSSPRTDSDEFDRTVVLLLRYDVSGALGLVVNRRHTEPVDLPLPAGTEYWYGGPVEVGGGFQFLHTLGDQIPDAEEVLPGVWIGGDEDVVRGLIAEIEPRLLEGRVVLGYSGWGAGQLDAEVAAGVWVVRPGDPELVFAADTDAVWLRALDDLGPAYAEFARLPSDTRLN